MKISLAFTVSVFMISKAICAHKEQRHAERPAFVTVKTETYCPGSTVSPVVEYDYENCTGKDWEQRFNAPNYTISNADFVQLWRVPNSLRDSGSISRDNLTTIGLHMQQ
jgi:hypothetical protein